MIQSNLNIKRLAVIKLSNNTKKVRHAENAYKNSGNLVHVEQHAEKYINREAIK